MKTKPMAHQIEGSSRLAANPEFYALGAEQGTGKTWMFLDDIETQFGAGDIEAALVVAPKGVHTNWIRREIPKHLEVDTLSTAFFSGAGKRLKEELNYVLNAKTGKLKVVSINIDALNTNAGFDYAMNFLRRHKTMMVIDESSRIKSPTAGRTKRVINLGKNAVSRRIGSGTLMPNGPLDIFSQFEFLAPGKGILGTTSYRAFVTEFAELVPENSGLMRHLREKKGIRGNPQIVKRNPDGSKRWKNLDRLQQLIAPYMFRVLKKDCLDLPDKVYRVYDFDLPPAQMRVYKEIEENLRYELGSDEITKFNALTKIMKLRQAVSGFIMIDNEAIGLMPGEDNPRLSLLKEVVEDCTGQVIIWAMFREEIAQIAAALKKMGITAVEYHGGIGDKEREIAVDSFQDGTARAFIGQPQSGGIGLTLTAATDVIYYSNDYNLETRLQSEDRAHRIGQANKVTYTDLAATGTIDERIANALILKEDVSNRILNYL